MLLVLLLLLLVLLLLSLLLLFWNLFPNQQDAKIQSALQPPSDWFECACVTTQVHAIVVVLPLPSRLLYRAFARNSSDFLNKIASKLILNCLTISECNPQSVLMIMKTATSFPVPEIVLAVNTKVG